MLKTIKFINIAVISLLFFGNFNSCKDAKTKDQATNTEKTLESSKQLSEEAAFKQSQEFKDYWFEGKAEISSYKLAQARYGELRDGHAVLVFVTEDFLPEKQVKADKYNEANTSVIKLNATKNFNTGIYPYSIMQSTFYPLSNTQHALKVSCTVQEWCGHVYSQLNNRNQFEISSHSYFETEADQNFKLNKAILENELWIQLRLNPETLPTGELQIIPAMEFISLKHVELKAYSAEVTLKEGTYTIRYPELDRTLSISFSEQFPYEILGWEESFKSGYGTSKKTLTTTAKKLETIKSAYWNKNSNTNENLRETLQLKK